MNTEPPNSMSPDLIESMIKNRNIRKAITKESHWLFFQFYFAHYIKFPFAPLHKEIFALTEEESIKNFFVVAFRGSGKSTIITTSYSLWAILGKQQKRFVLILCQTRSQAKQHMMNLRRELESNSLLKNDLGPFQEESDEWGSTSLVFSQLGVRITAASTEQSIRGLRHHQYRPDLIIGDDVEDMHSTKTREGREKTYEWLTSEVIPAGDQSTRLIVVGNLLHEDSLLMRLKSDLEENRIDGVFKEYPLLDEEEKIAWLGKYPTLKEIEDEKRKSGSDVAWYREYLLRIIPTEDQVVHLDWIHYYDALPSKEKTDYKFTNAGVDLAISQKSSADFTSVVIAQVHGSKDTRKIYILPNPINKRMSAPQTLQVCEEVIDTMINPGTMYVENIAYQDALVQLLREKGRHVVGVSVHGDKRTRLAMVTTLIQNGTILFSRKGHELLIQQLVGFGVEKHDDLVDAFTLVLLKLIEEDNKGVPRIRTLGRPNLPF